LTVAENQLASIIVKTPAELGIAQVPLPSNFVARYMAMDAGGCWYLFDSHPIYDCGEWTIRGGHWVELGIDGIDGGVRTPECAKGLSARDSLFEIAEAV
jgi:hypothetical protein